MSAISRRLTALEQRKQAVQGLRIFQQDLADGSVYYDFSGASGDRPYCQAEMDDLSAQGLQVLVIHYGPWPPFATEE